MCDRTGCVATDAVDFCFDWHEILLAEVECKMFSLVYNFFISNFSVFVFLFHYRCFRFSFFAFPKQWKIQTKINTILLNNSLGDHKKLWTIETKNLFNWKCFNKHIKHLVFTALWRLRLIRTLLSLSNSFERLAWLRLPVCTAASRRDGLWELASG